MHYILSALAAMMVSVMILVNGGLTAAFDLYLATVIIHIVGLLLVSAACLFKREKVFVLKGIKWTGLLGGAVGVATTMFNNQAFGKIDVSAIVALNLVGQAGSALLVDQFGLFGMKKTRMNKGKLIGLSCCVAGIAYMLSGSAFHLVAVTLSLATGVTLTLNRYINAQLASRTTPLVSTFYNYIIGLPVALIVWMLAVMMGLSAPAHALPGPAWIYLGGAMGVVIVLQANFSTPHIPAFLMTLIVFIGQIFASVLLDWGIQGTLSPANLIGGACVLAGLCLNVWMDARGAASASRPRAIP